MALGSQQSISHDTLLELRREAGKWLRTKREEAGLSQRSLAAAVGLEYYTFISQLKSGRGRVPVERYAAYAQALRIEPREFAITMMKYNDPVTYDLIFGTSLLKTPEREPARDAANKLADLEARLKSLEA